MKQITTINEIIRKILFFHLSDILYDRRVAPYIYRYLPEFRTKEIIAHYQEIAKENLIRLGFLEQFLFDSYKSGFCPVPFKGMYLIINIYRNPGARAMADIDLMIKGTEFERFLIFLKKYDYKIENQYFHATEGYVFWRGHKVELDIHTKPIKLNLFSCSATQLFENIQNIKFGSGTICAFGSIDNLILFFLHNLVANYKKIYSIPTMIDAFELLAHVLKKHEVTEIIARAEQLNVTCIVRFGLSVLNHYCNKTGMKTDSLTLNIIYPFYRYLIPEAQISFLRFSILSVLSRSVSWKSIYSELHHLVPKKLKSHLQPLKSFVRKFEVR